MGRKYYCEFCDKRMKDDVQIRKKHIEGLQHQSARSEHYARIKDVRTLLAEERQKTPCSRFQQNVCKFGAFCRFSHFTLGEIENMQQKVNQLDYQDWLAAQPPHFDESAISSFLHKRSETSLEIQEAVERVWPYPESLKRCQPYLPPSMMPLNPALFPQTFEEWGK